MTHAATELLFDLGHVRAAGEHSNAERGLVAAARLEESSTYGSQRAACAIETPSNRLWCRYRTILGVAVRARATGLGAARRVGEGAIEGALDSVLGVVQHMGSKLAAASCASTRAQILRHVFGSRVKPAYRRHSSASVSNV